MEESAEVKNLVVTEALITQSAAATFVCPGPRVRGQTERAKRRVLTLSLSLSRRLSINPLLATRVSIRRKQNIYSARWNGI